MSNSDQDKDQFSLKSVNHSSGQALISNDGIDNPGFVEIPMAVLGRSISQQSNKPDNFSGLTVKHFETFNEALNDLRSNDLSHEFNNYSNNYGMIVKVNAEVFALNEDQAETLVEKYGQYRSVLLAFESVTDGTCFIYWKTADRQEFLFVELKNEQEGQDSGIYEFVLHFVLNAIKNQHPGCKDEIIQGKAVDIAIKVLCDHRDYNLLMSADESNNTNLISTLIELEFNINDEIKGRSAADIAWNCGYQDILLQLLRNNSVFPKHFDPKSLTDGELKDFATVTEEFYRYSHARDKNNIKQIGHDYYNDKVLKDMDTALPDIQNKAKVKFERAQRKAALRKRVVVILVFALFFVPATSAYSSFALSSNYEENYVLPDPIYSWRNLTEELRMGVEQSRISFQGYNVSFKELLANNSKALNLLSPDQINGMIKTKSLNIGDKFQSNVEFYVERNFIKSGYWWNLKYFNFEDLTQVLEEHKVIILSGFVGTGKTTAYRKLAEKLKEQLKLKWVSYFNLKKHFDAFKAQTNDKDQGWDKQKLVNFIGKDLLSLNESIEFAVFEDRFNSDNVVLLWDGVDEVSPDLTDFISDLFKNIKKFSNNSQCVSSRPQYMYPLMGRLNQDFSFSLKSFTEEDRIEFLRTFFTFKNLTADLIEEKIQLFNEKIKGFNDTELYEYRSELSLPLIIRMFGEVLLDSSNSSLHFENKYLLYKEFVSKSFHITLHKGKVVSEDLQKIDQNQETNMYKIYEHFALELIVRDKFNLQIKTMPIDLSYEEISRYGIMLITSNDDFKFIHRAFAEFFVVQYLIDNVLQPEFTPRDEEIDTRVDLLYYMARNDEDFEVVLDFINDYLNLNLSQKPDETFAKVAEKRALALTDAGMRKDCFLRHIDIFINWLNLIPTFVSDDEEFLKNLWRLNEVENLFIYLTKTYPKESKNILSLARKHLPHEFTDEKIKKMSIEHAGNILFNYWNGFDPTEDDTSFYPEVVKLLPEELKSTSDFMDFFNETKQILTKSQVKLMIQTNIYEILTRTESQDFSKFLSTVNETLSKEEEIQSFIQSFSCHPHYFLMRRIQDEDFVITLIDEFEELADKTVNENFLKDLDVLQYSAGNINAKVFEKVAKFALKNLKIEDFDAVLSNEMLISDPIVRSSIETCESLANFLKEFYASNESELIKLIYEKDWEERTIFDRHNRGVYKLRLEPFRILAHEFPFPIPPEVFSFDPSLAFNSNFYSVLERFVEAKLKNSSDLMQAHMYFALKSDETFTEFISLPENLTLSALNGPGLLNLTSLEDSTFSHELYRDFFLAKLLIDRLYNAGNDTSAPEVENLLNLLNYSSDNASTLMLNYIDSDVTQVKAFPPLIRENVRNKASELIADSVKSCDHLLLKFFSKDEELLHLLLVESLIKKESISSLDCIKPVYGTVNVEKILQNKEFRTKIIGRLIDVKENRVAFLDLSYFIIFFPELIEGIESELKENTDINFVQYYFKFKAYL